MQSLMDGGLMKGPLTIATKLRNLHLNLELQREKDAIML